MLAVFRVRFSSIAERQYLEATLHYDSLQSGLGNRFEAEVDKATSSLKTFCKYEVKFDQIRRYNLKRFEYSLYYRVFEDQNLIQIEAVLHGRALFRSKRHS